MTRLIQSVIAFGLVVAPAAAEPTKTVIPKGAYTVEPADVANVIRGEYIYNNLHETFQPPTIYRMPNNLGSFIGDDLHMIAPGTVMTTFKWIYTDPGVGTHSSTLLFSNNTASDGVPVTSFAITTGVSGFTAAFLITGLPNATVNNLGGGWLITLPVPGINTGPDIWVGLASNSTTDSGPNTLGLRGTSTIPLVGSSHNLHYSANFSSATSFFTNPIGGNFRMAVLPEPGVAGLLLLGGLVALRRRARA